MDQDKKEILIKNINNWKHKLLDLGMKNKSLNFNIKTTKTISSKIQIIYPNLLDFLKSLDTSSKEIYEISNYKMLGLYKTDQLKNQVLYSHNLEEINKNNSFYKTKIYTQFGYFESKDILDLTLKKIYKISKTWKDEYSIDVLYLAFGFLKWYEANDSNEIRYAPLLLLPIELKKNLNTWSIHIKKAENFIQNEALVKKLKNDFDIDAELDLNKDDLINIYKTYSQKILNQVIDQRWEIIDDIYLANFDFSRINIYKDIEANINSIIESDFFKKIVDQTNNLDNDISTINEQNIDTKINILEQYKILDADSSQEIAIQNAILGKSFVLQGPPGTGKSQTITNIITELISRNKKILFVAEKNAALQVVYNNLKKIGLEKYAIPIHDSKINKSEILNELINSANNSQLFLLDDQKLESFVSNYQKIKEIFSNYKDVLLKKRSIEFDNVYGYINKYYLYKNYLDLNFEINNINKITNQNFEQYLQLINRFYESYKLIGFNYKNNLWYGFNKTNLDFLTKTQIFENLAKFNTEIENIKNYINKANVLANTNTINLEFILKITYLKEITDLYKNIKPLYKNQILEIKTLNEQLQKVNQLVEFYYIKNLLIQTLNNNWTNLDFINDNQIKQTIDYIKKTINKPLKVLSLKWNKYYKLFKKNLKNKTDIKQIDLIKELELFLDLFNTKKQATDFNEQLIFNIDIKDINQLLNTKQTLENMINLYNDQTISNTLLNILANQNKLDQLTNNINSFYDAYLEFLTLLNKDKTTYLKFSYLEFKNLIQNLINNKYQLDQYINFNFYKQELEKDLSDFINKIIENKITTNYEQIFLKRFYKLLIQNILDTELQNKDAIFMNSNLELFKTKDKEINNIAKDRIIMTLDKKIKESLIFENTNPQYSIIKRESAKKRLKMSFKTIFENALEFILNIKPCLMLSPLTVSYLFKDIDYKFDTVIFDEASQIKPETAISSLFRAKQVIIVGDKEQMPPTNFFNTLENDEVIEKTNIEQDISSGYESLLSLAEGNLDSIRLKWHYRSKFEDLIYTSNKFIYNDLITFPNSKLPKDYEGLRFIYSNPNQQTDEYHTILKALQTLKQIILTYQNKYSVGIVVFNTEIEAKANEYLDKFLEQNPDLLPFFNEDVKEPFFIKNIETVQGDERDFIIFIINGKINKNNRVGVVFGEINKQNGYKRLNVAISRAKRGMIVVSNFKHNDVDWFKSEQDGIKMLEKFIKNAELGVDNLKHLDLDSNSKSAFEQEVYEQLVLKGWKVKKQVGSSEFKIDLAVVDPRNQNKFLLAIECDGSAFNLAKSSRDRDRLYQQVLESRGWAFHRIWSTDWFKNPSLQIDLIEEKLNKLLNINKENKIETKIISNQTNADKFVKKTDRPTEIFQTYPSINKLIKQVGYHSLANQTGFFIKKVSDLENATSYILNQTGPLLLTSVYKIVRDITKQQRVSDTVKLAVRRMISSIGSLDKDQFLIPYGWEFKFRQSTNNDNKRSISEIHDKEIKHFILTIFKTNNMAISTTDFTKELTLKTYNKSISQNSIDKIQHVLDQMVKDKIIVEETKNVYRLI
ncbi:DUF4011 domain-containing protein [Mycoplasma mycoides]|uniref:DUF4011 domain-containing protein n=1 Tax=Mycoplasma mycoides TaxID=2102 RepID=UPI002736529A|nr:DUF4011 domain-containing protein [Mycoplasma mycoides]MDP4040814.1 DUF4011 domain-containing protein [Mycoplasma mycoides]MDP4041675.1 DUF4011 domain-containing protein [Mycoplasma mycoides]MDP4042579.1 DUF4011 domain-containing protein [Mycoplasma mycoides]MDP4044053.1 DUF4011 domain-containing protein [Mycoplasma mycoides]MDP4044924.1 DUF4011 domain-containing protein [Mycoplasma mycoides]